MTASWDDLEPRTTSLFKDKEYDDTGERLIQLLTHEFPGLRTAIEQLEASQPFKGVRISGCLHMTIESMCFIRTLVKLGAKVRWSSSNVNSSNDDAVHATATNFKDSVTLFGWKGESVEDFFWCLYQSLVWPDADGPDLLVDDGGSVNLIIHYGVLLEKQYEKEGKLLNLEDFDQNDRDMCCCVKFLNHLVKKNPNVWRKLAAGVIGLSEETTSGMAVARRIQKTFGLLFPVFNTNDSVSKCKFDNTYGARYSCIVGLCNGADSFLIGGKEVLVIGYGYVGKGVAQAFRGAGARVRVSEADPICALQAVMEGYDVVTVDDVCETADIFITATGSIDAITVEHMRRMKNNAIIGNIGQGDREIQMSELSQVKDLEVSKVYECSHYYKFKDTGKGVIILAYGRLYNLGCATGHPAFVMSMSFTTQTLVLLELLKNRGTGKLGNTIHILPKKVDETIARYHLDALNVRLTKLTKKQGDFMGIDPEGPYKSDGYMY